MPQVENLRFQRQKLNELVLERLMDWIMDGTLAMGERLNAEKIAQQLGVSRMPVREAFTMLEQLGLAEAIPYVGYRLIELDDKSVHELYVMRQILEPEAAYYACKNMDAEGLEELKSIHQQLQLEIFGEHPDPARLHSLNRDFHFAIYQYANMDRMYSVIRSLWNSLSFHKLVYGKRYISNKAAAMDMIEKHSGMISRLESGDAEGIKQLLFEDLRQHTIDVPATVSSLIGHGHAKEGSSDTGA